MDLYQIIVQMQIVLLVLLITYKFFKSFIFNSKGHKNNEGGQSAASKTESTCRKNSVEQSNDILDKNEKVLNISSDEAQVISRDSQETASNGQLNLEKELSIKEKFYLFLEKGFCPELEQGVEDPMYKYSQGKISDGCIEGLADFTAGFCPFKGLSGEDGYELDFEEEEDGEAEHQNRRDSSQAAIKRADKCPFQFGLKDGADSEEEADVPKSHKQNKTCPFQTAIKCNQDGQIDGFLANVNPKNKLEHIESSLTEEELRNEAAIREAQMSAILKLLEEQENMMGKTSPTDFSAQLKLYM